MNVYLVQYSEGGVWIPLCVRGDGTSEVHNWATTNIQPKGVCTTQLIINHA